jgi:hypothetical protein
MDIEGQLLKINDEMLENQIDRVLGENITWKKKKFLFFLYC